MGVCQKGVASTMLSVTAPFYLTALPLTNEPGQKGMFELVTDPDTLDGQHTFFEPCRSFGFEQMDERRTIWGTHFKKEAGKRLENGEDSSASFVQEVLPASNPNQPGH